MQQELPRTTRLGLVEQNDPELPLSLKAKLLGVSRSHLYYQPRLPSEEITIKHRIDDIYPQYPFYGSQRISEQLHADGWQISHKAVQRHMHEMGLEAMYPDPNLSKRREAGQVYPYLLRGLTISHPNQVWGIDLAYVRFYPGWMYLVTIVDGMPARWSVENRIKPWRGPLS